MTLSNRAETGDRLRKRESKRVGDKGEEEKSKTQNTTKKKNICDSLVKLLGSYQMALDLMTCLGKKRLLGRLG
jgi:hypothetical protein